MTRSLCFVLMPSGRQRPGMGSAVDFDAVYAKLVRPAIEAAGLEPLRGDAGPAGGLERLLLCEHAVVDLTAADAAVGYALGIRHALRSGGTVTILAAGSPPPFDVPCDAGLPPALAYRLTAAGTPAAPAEDGQALAARLQGGEAPDSPVFRLVRDLPVPDIKRLKTDTFREQVFYAARMKQMLAEARRQGAAALRRIEQAVTPVTDAEAGVVVDLLLSYRAVGAWTEMIDLVDRMASPLAATVMVQEQLGFALNRAGRGRDAERVLMALARRAGPSSETLGLLGRVYKDRWEGALRDGDEAAAREALDQAIRTYREGFEADWRDAYPGVNAVTLMELRNPPDPRRRDLLPVVAYAVERRIASGAPDYWDYATRLELAVLRLDPAAAEAALADALAHVREPWEAGTTARNLRLIREARERRGEPAAWADAVEQRLNERAAVLRVA